MRSMSTLNTQPLTTTTTTATTKASFSPPDMTQQRSPWHSPVPYLFGGLAAMLGLIAFALLILACSYWRLSGRLDSSEGGDQRDLESGNEKEGDSVKPVKVYEEKFLVIMAGNEKPTFLATPVSSRASSFGDKNGKIETKEGDKVENGDKVKEDMGDHEHMPSTTTENRETQETQQGLVQEQTQ